MQGRSDSEPLAARNVKRVETVLLNRLADGDAEKCGAAARECGEQKDGREEEEEEEEEVVREGEGGGGRGRDCSVVSGRVRGWG